MDDKESINTKKANEAAVRLFERFLVEKGWVKEDSIADAVQAEQHCWVHLLLGFASSFSAFLCPVNCIVDSPPSNICIIIIM